MGRHKIVREFPLKPKYVKWQDGRERDEIEAILQQLSGHMPEECKGQLCKGILWACRQLQECYKTIKQEDMEYMEYTLNMRAYNDEQTPIDEKLSNQLFVEQLVGQSHSHERSSRIRRIPEP